MAFLVDFLKEGNDRGLLIGFINLYILLVL